MPVTAPPSGLFTQPKVTPPPPGLFEPDPEPGILSSGFNFATETAKDFVVSTVTGIPGLLIQGQHNIKKKQQDLAESIVGKRLSIPLSPFTGLADVFSEETGSNLLGIADASYQEALDAEADTALALSRSTGLPLEVTVGATSAAFTGAQFLSPGKYARMVLGIAGKAAVVAGAGVYGGHKLLKLGQKKFGSIRGTTEIAKRAAQTGDMVDPMRSLVHAEEVAKGAAGMARESTEAVAVRARQKALFPEMFTEEPLSRTASASYLEALEASDVPSALKKLKASERAATVKAAKLSDPQLKKVQEEIAAAYREVGASVDDAAKAGRLGNHVLPTDVPDLIITDPVEAAQNLGRQHLYRREHSRFIAQERENRLKAVLSSVDPTSPRKARKAAESADTQLREDLTFWVQQTGNPNVTATDDVADVLSRINAHPRGEAALAVTEWIRPMLDNLFDEMSDLNVRVGDKEISYVENYLHQAWKPPRVGGKGGKGGFGGSRGLLDSGLFRGRENVVDARTRIRGRFEEARTLPTYHAGITKAGLEPRTLDIAEVLHVAERQYGETMAVKKLLSDIGELQRMPDGSPAFLRVKGRFPKGVNEADYTKAEVPYISRMVEGEGDLLVHKQVFKPLRNTIEGLAKNEGSWIDDLSVLNKRSNFAFTMFHAYSLAENALLSLGFLKGAKTLGGVVRRGGGIPFASRLGGPRALDHLTQTNSMRESTLRGLKYNLVVETPRTDLMRNVWDKASAEASARLGKGGAISKASGKALEGLTWAQKNFDAALWERMHAPLKVTVFDELFDTVLAAKKAGGKGAARFKTGGIAGRFKGRDLAKLSDDEIGYRVASFVNDEFGGQAWEVLNDKFGRLLARPKTLRKLRRYWISPDWNISSFRANLAMGSLLLPGGDPVRGVLGARHWRNSMIGFAGSLHALNFMLTQAFEGKGRMAYENDPGKDGMIGGILPTHIATGMKDEKGRRIYVRVGKQLQEVPEFLESPPEFVGRKMIGWARTLQNMLAREKDPFSNIGQAMQNAREEGVELDGIDKGLAYGKDFAEAFSPFGTLGNPLKDTPPLGPLSDLLVPLPQSLGGSRGRLQRRYQKALNEKDFDMQRRINESLLANGYTPKQITTMINTARTKAMQEGRVDGP